MPIPRQGEPDRWIIIDYERDLIFPLHDHQSFPAGRVNRIVAPFPSFGVAQSLPP
jgi:hypothetical protein